MSKTKIGEEQMPDEYYDLERRTEIKATSNRLKKQFLTWRECEIVYSLQHRKLLKLADEAGAIYRFDGVVLINREIFEAYLEQFRQEPLTQGQVRKVKNRWEQMSDYSGSPEPVNPLFRATCSDWQSRSE